MKMIATCFPSFFLPLQFFLCLRRAYYLNVPVLPLVLVLALCVHTPVEQLTFLMDSVASGHTFMDTEQTYLATRLVIESLTLEVMALTTLNPVAACLCYVRSREIVCVCTKDSRQAL